MDIIKEWERKNEKCLEREKKCLQDRVPINDLSYKNNIKVICGKRIIYTRKLDAKEKR